MPMCPGSTQEAHQVGWEDAGRGLPQPELSLVWGSVRTGQAEVKEW